MPAMTLGGARVSLPPCARCPLRSLAVGPTGEGEPMGTRTKAIAIVVAVTVVVVAAVGGASVLSREDTTSTTTTSEPATTTSVPGGDPVLLGAGDITSCSSSGDEATAALLGASPGTVFTTGDNAYDSGTTAEFADCYDPSWGAYKA